MSKQRKRIVPNVVRGGTAIPIGDNLFYMQGRKHEQGGIDIGDNAKTGLEVEGGEVVQTSPKSIKVFSSVPFLYGGSPANLVMSGADPNKVFNAQERFKDINKINDDGSMKQYKNGGLSRSKNYGSSKKPYPSVKSEDFAGGNRSYPIPTKADAIDALRLAGLHGRSDVKAKVYRKYPELRKKALFGIDEPIDSLSMVPGLNIPTVTAYSPIEVYDEITPAGVVANTPETEEYIRNNTGFRGIFNNIKNRIRTFRNNSRNNDYLSNLQRELEQEQAARMAERERRANVIRNASIGNININNRNNNTASVRTTPISDIDLIPTSAFWDRQKIAQMPIDIPEDNIEIPDIQIEDIDLNVPRYNYTPNTITSRSSYVPNSDLKTGIKITPNTETKTETNTETKTKANINNTPSPSTKQIQSSTIAQTTTPVGREVDNTFGEWDRALIRNVSLPTVRATTNQGLNLDDRVNQYINDRISTNREQQRNKNNVDYTSLILDGIGSLANIGGNIASNIINRRMLNDLEYSSAPIPLSPAKLKTRININPQLQRLYRDLGIMEDSVNSNTTSSRTALARNQRLRNQARQIANELYGNKENIETLLINRDRLNQQRVAASNLARYDKWRAGKTEFNNKVREMLSENDVALTQGVAGAISDMLNSIATRNQEAKNLAYLSMSNPYAVEALNSTDFKNLYRMYGGFRCGGKKKINRK